MRQFTLAVGKLLQSGSHPKIWLVKLLGASGAGSTPPSEPRAEGQLQPWAATVQLRSPSVMMVPKQISFGTLPTADVYVLFEDQI